jgi:hypothetical protein
VKLPVRTRLIAGPYAAPAIRRGGLIAGGVYSRLKGEITAGTYPLRGLTTAPIPWPYTYASGTRRQLIITGDLIRAIRTESVIAVSYHWAVSRWWVERCRAALEVPRMTEGTRELWSALASIRFRRRRGGYGAPKLTEAQARAIRDRAIGGESAAVLSGEFGVTRQYVGQLVRGERRAASAARD